MVAIKIILFVLSVICIFAGGLFIGLNDRFHEETLAVMRIAGEKDQVVRDLAEAKDTIQKLQGYNSMLWSELDDLTRWRTGKPPAAAGPAMRAVIRDKTGDMFCATWDGEGWFAIGFYFRPDAIDAWRPLPE